jgi:hypothetical protein
MPRARNPKGERSHPGPGGRRWTAAELDALIEEATVDAYGDADQCGGLFTMIEEHLTSPFETELLGVPVTVEGVDLTEAEEIVAVRRRGRARQAMSILDLPLPDPPPARAEWIAAYRRWARGR